MQTAITSAQISQYKSALQNGSMTVGQFYDIMLKQGYEYAGWAAGYLGMKCDIEICLWQ